jgi:hypothetical protein
VRDFIGVEDLDIFGNDEMFKLMMMKSIEEQEICSVFQKFNVSRDTQDPNIDYYIDKSNRPTIMLQNLVKDLSKNYMIFDMETKMDFIGKVADLIKLIRNSFGEHLNNIHARTYAEIKLF